MSLSAPCTTRSRIAGIDRTRTLPPSFGISCLRAGSGTIGALIEFVPNLLEERLYALAPRWPRRSPRQCPERRRSSWPAQYASRSVSILQTWTYNPQNRQDGLSLRLDVYPPPQVLQIDGRLCHLVLAFLIVGDITNSRAPSLRGHYPASSLLRTHPPPSRLRSISRLCRLYDLPCSGDFSPGRGGLLQLLGMSLSPCCRFHPAESESPHRSDFGIPCCLRPTVAGSASRSHSFSRPHPRSLSLRPGDSSSPQGRPCR